MATTKNGIPYPDDYNAVADVPEDMKKMAEATDELIDELKTDVANIEKEQLVQNSSISSLNYYVEQNSEEIYENANNIVELQKENTALKEELERQKEDNRLNGLTEDNEGELLHITNTTGARFNSLEIFGNEKQKTRSGKNIYGAGSKWFNNIGGTNLNVSERTDSSCVLTATGRGFTSLGSGQAGGSSEYRTEVEPNTEYTFSLKAELLSGSNGFGIYAFFSKDGSSEYFSEKHVDYADEITFVTPEDAKYFYFRVDIFNASASYRISEIQLEKGSKATEFEEYGAMPSFDYPSEVKAVGGNVNIFNDEVYKGFEVTQQNYNALEKVDLKLEANKYYVAKIWFEDGTYVATNDSNFMLYGYKADGTLSMNIPNGIAKTYSNATELVKAKIVANSTGLSTYANKVVSGIKIEEVANKAGQATSYSTYEKGCVGIRIENKNLYNVKDVKGTLGNVVVNDEDFITMTYDNTSGTSTYFTNYFTNKNKYLKPKTKYYGVLEIKSVTGKGSIFVSGQNAREAQTDAWLEFNLQNLSNNSKKLFEFTTLKEEEFENCVYMFRSYLMTTAGQSATVSFRISVFEEQQDLDTFVYQKHEEQSFVMPVQQKMFTGDGFVKVNGLWKEMHSFKEIKLSEAVFLKTDNSQQSDTILRFTASFTDGNLVMYNRSDSRTFWSDKSECVYILDAYQKECLAPHNSATNQLNVFISKNRLTNETVEAFKQYLVQNEIIVYYKLLKPLYLDCTKEQIEILDKIEKEAHTYKEVTNVYTEDEVGAILKTNTNVDLKSLINNIQEQLIAE